MSNASLESSHHQRAERAPERGNSADIASSAYTREASSNLHRNSGPNTADQHLNNATITKDSISFGASSGGLSGDHGFGIHDNMPVMNRQDAGSGTKIHDNMPVMNGKDAGRGLNVHDNMPVIDGKTGNGVKLRDEGIVSKEPGSGVKLHDDGIVSKAPGSGVKLHDDGIVSKDPGSGVKLHDEGIVSKGDSAHKLPPGQDSSAMGQGNKPEAAATAPNGSDHVRKIPAERPDTASSEAKGAGPSDDKRFGDSVGGAHSGAKTNEPIDPTRDTGAPNAEQRSTGCTGTGFQSSLNSEHSEAPAHHDAHVAVHPSHHEGQSHAHAHASHHEGYSHGHASHAEGHGQAHAHHEHHQTKHPEIGHGTGGGSRQSPRGSGVAGELKKDVPHCSVG